MEETQITKEIESLLQSKKCILGFRPEILDVSKDSDRKRFTALLSSPEVQRVVDTYKAQQEELFAIKNPAVKFSEGFREAFDKYYVQLLEAKSEVEVGRWVYFPWNKTIMHLLEEKEFHIVRTARNKPLLTESEQNTFYNTTVAIAGLSVGNAVALSIVHQGGSRRIKIADHDTLDLSNLNRIRGDVASLGSSKVEMTARQIYELNPYAEVEVFTEGLSDATIDAFLSEANVLIDEMDDLPWKYKLREHARNLKLPLISAADLDRRSIIAVERYDIDQQIMLFNGRLGDITLQELTNLDKRTTGKYIAQLVGVENHTARMLDSLNLIGKEIISWPQLGPTASMGGALITFCVERIANKKPMPSINTTVALDQLLDTEYNSEVEVNRRQNAVTSFRQIFNL